MALKKTAPKILPKKTAKKEDKLSVEELRKRKEEVLARINAEIGDSEDEIPPVEDTVPVSDESEGEVDNSEAESKKELEEEMLKDEEEISQEEQQEAKEDVEDKIIKESAEENIEVVKADDDEDIKISDIPVRSMEDLSKGKDSESESLASTFSASEFGLSNGEGSKKRNILLFIVVFLLVALVSAIFYFFFTGSLKFEPSQQPVVETVSPTQAPTATPTPVEFNRSELSVNVLNGSGVGGAAGKMQTLLEDLGYEDIEVGNAETSDYINVTLQLKQDYEQFGELISEDLKDDYVVNDNIEALDSDSEFDVVIIIGQEEDVASDEDE